MSFTVNVVNSTLMMFFYIFSQIKSLTASAYIREVKISIFTEYLLFSSLTVNAVNVSITLKIFVMNSLKLMSLFFYLFFNISMYRNVLTFLIEMLMSK